MKFGDIMRLNKIAAVLALTTVLDFRRIRLTYGAGFLIMTAIFAAHGDFRIKCWHRSVWKINVSGMETNRNIIGGIISLSIELINLISVMKCCPTRTINNIKHCLNITREIFCWWWRLHCIFDGNIVCVILYDATVAFAKLSKGKWPRLIFISTVINFASLIV